MVKKTKSIKLPAFYFSFQVLWLRLTGIEVLKDRDGVLYRIYSTVVLLFTTTHVFIEYVELPFHKDPDTIAMIGWYIINHSLTMAKVMVIYRNRRQIGDLIKSFHEGFYKPDKTRGGDFEEECIDKILGQSGCQMKQYGIVILLAWITTLVETLKPRFTLAPQYWTLPFMPMSLVDITHSPTYEISYFYQGLAIGIISLWIYICDCTVIAIIAQTTAQFKILEHSIRNYKSRSLKMQSENKEAPISNTLRYTIRHHLNLLETVDKVEYLCSYLVLCVFLANLILLCLVMYYTSMAPVKSVEFFRYLSYCGVIAIQLLLYCWWGNEMTLANEALAIAIFEAYDPDDPVPYSKALKLMLVKAQKPIFFTAGKFVPLSLETYKAIIKGSFSYFTVLRKINFKQ